MTPHPRDIFKKKFQYVKILAHTWPRDLLLITGRESVSLCFVLTVFAETLFSTFYLPNTWSGPLMSLVTGVMKTHDSRLAVRRCVIRGDNSSPSLIFSRLPSAHDSCLLISLFFAFIIPTHNKRPKLYISLTCYDEEIRTDYCYLCPAKDSFPF